MIAVMQNGNQNAIRLIAITAEGDRYMKTEQHKSSEEEETSTNQDRIRTLRMRSLSTRLSQLNNRPPSGWRAQRGNSNWQQQSRRRQQEGL